MHHTLDRPHDNEITRLIVDSCIRSHRTLGPGLLESVYEAILTIELRQLGLEVRTQVEFPIVWRGEQLADVFRLDLLVEDRIIVELKATERSHPVFRRVLLTYLRLSGKSLGLVVNFGLPLVRDGIERVINQGPSLNP